MRSSQIKERDQPALAQFALELSFPVSFTPWIWKTNLAVSRPIMVMLTVDGSAAVSNNPQCGTEGGAITPLFK